MSSDSLHRAGGVSIKRACFMCYYNSIVLKKVGRAYLYLQYIDYKLVVPPPGGSDDMTPGKRRHRKSRSKR